MSTPLTALVSEAFCGTDLLRFPSLCGVAGFSHAITTRPWNLSTHQGPDMDMAVERRRQLCRHLGFSFDRLTAANQIHSPHVLRVREGDVGAGRDGRHSALDFTDGLICDLPGVPLVQFSADCPIVVLVEPRRRIIGTAHASWRGTVAGITSELLRQLEREFQIDAADLVAGICPCAGPEQYEVGEIVRRIATSRLNGAEKYFSSVNGRLCFDMRGANVDQLLRGGVRLENISVADISTMSDPRLYSHRRDGPSTGRFGFIGGFLDP